MDYQSLRILDTDTEETRAEKRHTAAGLLRLRRGLEEHFAAAETARSESAGPTIRIATWNLREFATRNKYGERLDEAYWYIAEILSRFHLVALQEVRGDLGALHRVLAHLGPEWDYIATDVTEGAPGNGERMVYVYDRRHVSFGGIAGELTLPGGREILDARGVDLWSAEGLTVQFDKRRELRVPAGTKTRTKNGELQTAEVAHLELPEGAALRLPGGTRLRLPTGTPVSRVGELGLRVARSNRHELGAGERLQIPRPARADGALQFARTPYYVTFRAGGRKLILCTVHIYYGEEGERSAGMQRRIAEIERITDVLAKRARDETEADPDSLFLLLGDFNIVGKEHQTMGSLERQGFAVPAAIRQIPRGSNVPRDKFYDQIAAYGGGGGGKVDAARLGSARAGIFDYFEYVYRTGADDEARLGASMRRHRKARGGSRAWAYRSWRTYQMSDHLPMWIELRVGEGVGVLRDLAESGT